MNVLMDTNRHRHQYTSITLTNTLSPFLRVFMEEFLVLARCNTKFDCLIKHVQSFNQLSTDSVSAKVFA